MKVKKTIVTTQIVDIDLKFPFFGWWANDKTEIVKIDYQSPTTLKCVYIKKGFGFDESISTQRLSVINGIIDGDLLTILRDYDVVATEQEFEKIKQDIINSL